MSNRLSIDPSKNNLGWALLDHQDNWHVGVFRPKGVGLDERLWSIGRWLDERFVKVMTIDTLIIEYPQFFDSEKGRIAARAGYTIDLGCIIGFIIGWIGAGARVHLYKPNQWKGSVPKDITYKKMQRKFELGNRKFTDDEVDAMMLLYFHETHKQP